ncbi:hypothetical protein ACFSJY_03920 [Thalassotalea euphylliae]|uniref:hypothetical protein n=1 Tax=Thalassotalea euphylliae TaxID=1655234 RepID=UPI0036395BF6
MRVFSLLLASVLSLSVVGCQSTVPKQPRLADNLNIENLGSLKMRWPNTIKKQSMLVETLLAELKLTESRTIDVRQHHHSSTDTTIEALNTNVLDDSIKQVYYRVRFTKQTNGYWQPFIAEQAFQCRRNNSDTFAARYCP